MLPKVHKATLNKATHCHVEIIWEDVRTGFERFLKSLNWSSAASAKKEVQKLKIKIMISISNFVYKIAVTSYIIDLCDAHVNL